MNLFIIGNGFDLNEGLATSYADFKIYLENNNPSLLDDLRLFYNDIIDSEIDPKIIDFGISNLINTNGEMFLYKNIELWSAFETNLGNVSLSNLRGEFGFDKFPINNYDERLKYLLNYFQTMLDDLRIELKKWVNSIEIKPTLFLKKFIDKNLFINFNYTNTLKIRYLVDDKSVCYLHNNKNSNEVVFGCCKDDIEKFAMFKRDDIVSSKMAKMLTKILEKNVKKSGKIIEDKLEPYLNNHVINKIIVLGSSFSNADLPYFIYLSNKYPNAERIVSYHSLDDKENINNFISMTNNISIKLVNNIDEILSQFVENVYIF